MALTGPNGSGKSTLLNILSGEQTLFDGELMLPRAVSLGYLRQEIPQDFLNRGLLEEVLSARREVLEMEKEMAALEQAMSEDADEGDMKRYSELQEQFRHQEGYELESRAQAILGGLGFQAGDMQRPLDSFSGGWRMRIAMAKLLFSNPSVLLLDEPTNHLDLETLEWFENFLASYSGTVVMVSHDRYFLDRLCREVAELDQLRVKVWKGNYSEYESQKAVEIEQLRARAGQLENKRRQTEAFIERFRYKSSKAKQVQSRIKMLEKQEKIELYREQSRIRFDFPPAKRSGDIVVDIRDLDFAYEPGKAVFSSVSMQIRRGDRVALAGVNGSGKSTLIKLLVGELQAEEGRIRSGHNVSIGYFAQHQLQNLNPANTVLEEMMPHSRGRTVTQMRSALGNFLFSGDDADKRISVLSGGEKSRIVLLKMLLGEHNFLIMDEPTNHLDMDSREILAEALEAYGGTLLLVSHDRFFMDLLVDRIYWFDAGELRYFSGNYTDFHRSRVLGDGQTPVRAEGGALGGEKRQAGASGAASGAVPGKDGALPGPDLKNRSAVSDGRLSLKERKRLEAEERQRKFALKKDAMAEIAVLERRMEAIEEERAGIHALMASEEWLALPEGERRVKSLKLRDLEPEKERLESRWLELSDHIETIENSQ